MCNNRIVSRPLGSCNRPELDLTHEQYFDLLKIVVHRCYGLGDPEDILQQTLLRALEKFNHVDNIQGFVNGTCRYMAFMMLKRKRPIPFCELGNHNEDEKERDDYLETLTVTHYPEYQDPVEGTLVADIEKMIDGLQANQANAWAYTQSTKKRIKAVLRVLANSANKGAGIGVDEYGQMQPVKNRWTNKRYFGQAELLASKPARGLIKQNLAAVLGVTKTTITNDMSALRRCAEVVMPHQA